jgi:hypothetical protein
VTEQVDASDHPESPATRRRLVRVGRYFQDKDWLIKQTHSDDQSTRRSARRELFELDLLKTLRLDHEVRDLNQGYQYRVDGKLDIYPTHRRWHLLRTGQRGEYGKSTAVEDVEMLLSGSIPSRRKQHPRRRSSS